ncbi:MAG: type VI secretion system-associated FHA domain protein TagH [Proteobacteria bacterium]|nr:type VI secretion system-associated FHA domain protein TagH [Pseudomonadota bacterium]MBU6424722.1 type VI secretion system-associated FHA domain protein TagH [Rhodospirillales bacterium]
MTLTLTVLRCPDAVPPETKQISGGEFRIGRGPDNDWIMPDPDRLLSKRHCVIAFRNGGWAIADISKNGTYLNRDAEPVGNGQIRELRDGDRIRFGAYEIEARVAEAQGFAASASGFGRASSPFDDPFGGDVFAPKPPPTDSFTSAAFGADDPLFGAPPRPASVRMPDQFDPLAGPETDFFGAPTQPDHTPSFSDAFQPPAARQTLPEDDDWDLSPLPAQQPAPKPAVPPQSFEPPPAVQSSPFGEAESFSRPAPQPPAPLPPRPVPEANPFAESADFRPVPPPASMPPPPMPPEPPRAMAPAPMPPQGATGGDALLAAFLKGAGLESTAPANPEALMQALGGTFRALVSGIRQALIARAAIKGEFRIEQTMIRARGNNPLKFSADDDDALTALLGLGRRVDMGPDAAVSDALRDMRLHELATMAAMQDAVRALLAQLDPAKLQADGGMALLPAQKKARAFEAYEKLHETITRALADDFDSVFGKSFARAYENALREISAREP